MLTVEQVADHYRLKPDTVRARIKVGDLQATRINRLYRLTWEQVWSCERGPMPAGARRAQYQRPLLTKRNLAGVFAVCERTVERWIGIEDGLPTRCVFGAVRINAGDARHWLQTVKGITPPPGFGACPGVRTTRPRSP